MSDIASELGLGKTTGPAGLGNSDPSQWPKPPAGFNGRPIELLKPGSDHHGAVLNYLLLRLRDSEDKMSNFYSRWRWNEKRTQAYIDLPKYEQMLKESTQKGEPPKVTSMVMPYSFATISTIVTYLIQALAGRKPIFQVTTNNDRAVDAARMMELMLQYNCDHVRLISNLFQFLNDGELYGVGIMVTAWKQEKAKRTKWISAPSQGFLSMLGSAMGGQAQKKIRVREDSIVFEGTSVRAQDPFTFFPDPRVPMAQVNRRGEYVFWRTFEGKHTLKLAEARGEFAWINNVGTLKPSTRNSSNDTSYGPSDRSLLAQGDAQPGLNQSTSGNMDYIQVDQGSIWIIPKELGLGESTLPEMWIFAIGNRTQIIQAQKLELDHGMHPVVVSEPYTMGYGFGQAGISDYLGPVQDTVSWFVNSHIHNVRTALNNMFVVDPSMVEMQDLKHPGPGKFIRLKRSAYGRDTRQALSQLQVMDVTRGHVADLDAFMRIGDALASVNDNLRGLQDSGGRKSATEARTSAEAAASRLAAHAKLISSQALADLAEQMSINYQQFMSESFYVTVVGKEKAISEPIRVLPEQLVGDFTFPINDGTLPLDRVALLDVWKEVLTAAMQDQELRSTYSIPKLFAYVAELGGAKNLESMQLRPTEQVMQQVQAGNMVPMTELGNLPASGTTPGVQPGGPAQRLAGPLGGI